MRAEDCVLLEVRLGNTEAWVVDTKRQCLHRNCVATLTEAPDATVPASVNSDRNIRLLLRKTIHKDVLPFVDYATAAGIYAAVLSMALNKDMVRRQILKHARDLRCTGDVVTYVTAHQNAHGHLLTLDPETQDDRL